MNEELTPEILSQVSGSQLEQIVFQNILSTIKHSDEEYIEAVKSLSHSKRVVFVIHIIEKEVNNGGFNQFYFNRTKQFGAMAEDAFESIGAFKFAEIVKAANLFYSVIEKDLEKYDDGSLESFSESYSDNPLNELDHKFYQLYNEEPLDQLLIRFIRTHIKELL